MVKGLGEVAGEAVDGLVAQVGAQGLDVGGVDGGDHGGEELGCGDDEVVDRGGVDGFEEGSEGNGLDGGLKGGERHGVVDGFGVAHLDVGHGGFGEFGLEGEDVLGVEQGLLRRFAGEGEDVGDVLDELVANLDVFGAGAGVVVALGQAEAALADDGDLLGGVFEVLSFAEAEEDADAVALELAGEVGKSGLADLVDLVEQRLDGGEAFLLDEVGVHAGGVVVADLGLGGCAGGGGCGVGLEDVVEGLGVDVVEKVELVYAGLVGGDGMVGGEVAAGVLVEVGAGVGFGVERAGVEGRRWDVVGFGRCGCGGLSEDSGGEREGGGEKGGGADVHSRLR